MTNSTTAQKMCNNFSDDFKLQLDELDAAPDALFTIECYTDSDKDAGEVKPDPDPLMSHFRGRTRAEAIQLLPKLKELNEKGAGIFISVNRFANRRKKEELSRIRAVHADLDHATEEQLLALFQRATPTFIVESSPGKFHFYWVISDEVLTIEEAEGINRHFVADYGADPAAVDVTRLLRLVGFKHNKKRKHGITPTVKICVTGGTYTGGQLRQLFPPTEKNPHNQILVSLPLASPSTSTLDPIVLQDIADEAIRRNPEALLRPLSGNRYPSDSEADLASCGLISHICAERGMPLPELATWVEAAFGLTDGGKRQKWLDRPDYRSGTIAKALSGAITKVSAASAIRNQHAPAYNDIFNARRFCDRNKSEVRFVHEEGVWLEWVNQSWIRCNKGEEIQRAKRNAQEIAVSDLGLLTLLLGGEDAAKRHAKKAHEAARLKAALELAATEPNIATSVLELNNDPYLLGVKNGVVNLKTGQLIPNDPSFLITMYCNASLPKEAQCPNWLRFLDQLFPNDPKTIKAIQLLLGYTLTGLNTEEILIVLVGGGTNGKSVFSNIVVHILGGYAKTAPSNILKARRSDDSSPRDDIASLVGARYVSINETQAGDKLDSQAVKMLAGREPISARHLYGKYFTFFPKFAPWLRTNHLPIVTDTDDGIWRRLAIIPFNQQFKGKQQDPHLEEKLKTEADGILGWMVDGAVDYLKNDLKLSPTIKRESARYRSESDVFGEFLQTNTTKCVGSEIEQKLLWTKWRFWAGDAGFATGTKNSMTRRMRERGFGTRESNSKSYYTGVEERQDYPRGAG